MSLDQPRVCIQVQSVYIAHQSQPEQQQFVFAYLITIRNVGRHTIQLVRRYWQITNGNGKQTEVLGDGVVGQQPYILAGEEYQYTSGAVLETPIGTMVGYYEMVDHQGNLFKVDIPLFRLAVNNIIN